jgi:hypothetical protein
MRLIYRIMMLELLKFYPSDDLFLWRVSIESLKLFPFPPHLLVFHYDLIF